MIVAIEVKYFGFDSVVLWHIFSPAVAEERIKSYANIVGEVIDRLELPSVYLVTTILDSELSIHKPFDIQKYDLQSLVMWLQNLCSNKRNPAMDRQIEIRRKSLKVALQIPT
ncbi:hypothetical protein ES707_04506 [subsurface metagenome]